MGNSGVREMRSMYAWETWLRDLGWSKQHLAHRLGVRPATVSSWGESPPAYVEVHVHLALEVRAKALDMLRMVSVNDPTTRRWVSGNGLFVPYEA